MTRLEFLKETIEYYMEDPSRRGCNHDMAQCAYLDENGNKCAVGRMLNEYALGKYGDVGLCASDLLKDMDFDLEGHFKKEYLTLLSNDDDIQTLLDEVQQLHDLESTWDDFNCAKDTLDRLKLEDYEIEYALSVFPEGYNRRYNK